jgi:hypothetical protein
VKRHLLDLGALFVAATIICSYIALAHPSVSNMTVHIYVLVVGGLLMLALITALGDAIPHRRNSELDFALAGPPRPERPSTEIERVEREVTLAVASAYDLHVRLLPHLREIAQSRLERKGQTADAHTLGPWWDLLRPDRPEPEDRFGPGISEAELRALVSDLERM